MNEKEFIRRFGSKKRTFAYLWLLIGMLALLVTASFAWFSVSNVARVNEMALYVNADQGLTIAESYATPEEEWGSNLYFPDLISEESPLKPVTWSEENHCFKGIRYGYDGRQTNTWRTLSDAENANTSGNDQYYVYTPFYMKTDTACTVALTEAIELNDGEAGAGTYVIGTPKWNELTHMHEDAGNGAERAVRIGFLITKVNPNTGNAIGTSTFYIYEPNGDSHIDGYDQYLDTNSIDGTDTLVPPERMIVQTSSIWREASPIQRDVTLKTLGTFTTDANLFHLSVGEMARVTMYIWIEGQDLDCYGLPNVSELSANIQFKADYSEQSGIKEIPDNFERVN